MLTIHSTVNTMTEFAFRSSARYADPYNDVDLDVTFSAKGKVLRVPAFWAGENVWKVRFAPPSRGTWRYVTTCSNHPDAGLHNQKGEIVASAYRGKNSLLRHGRLRVSKNRRYLEHADGTPFFWLGDTWWMGLTKRIKWPHEFQMLAADRVEKGFSVVQIIAGPLPDMTAFDPRGKNEAGFPFTRDFSRLNPEYYDLADLKIGHLVSVGLMPAIVGMWGYYLSEIGVEGVKRFWRYIVARYAAYPVVWCLAGEVTMPFYLSKTPKEDAAVQRKGWTEVARTVQKIDGFDNPITIHPGQNARDGEDPTVFEFEWHQTGHGGYDSILNTANSMIAAVGREPTMPVLVSEVNYEGILGRSWQDVERMCFWLSVLNGACGHTYGANGIWQASTKEQPYGPSPHGRCWGNTPWQEAMHLPGSRQLGLARKLLAELPWWQMTPHHEWVENGWDGKDYWRAVAAGIPKKLRVIYAPSVWNPPKVLGVEPGIRYTASYFDPTNGERIPLGEVKPGADRSWTPPVPPEVHDWVIIMRAS